MFDHLDEYIPRIISFSRDGSCLNSPVKKRKKKTVKKEKATINIVKR